MWGCANPYLRWAAGQFLLIEAADHLPRWVSPATADNRVFFSDGKLHLVPTPTSPVRIVSAGCCECSDIYEEGGSVSEGEG